MRWYISQFDLTATFLKGHLEEQVYKEPPDRLKVTTRKCLKLKHCKALYGLKQASWAWFKTFTATMSAHKQLSVVFWSAFTLTMGWSSAKGVTKVLSHSANFRT